MPGTNEARVIRVGEKPQWERAMELLGRVPGILYVRDADCNPDDAQIAVLILRECGIPGSDQLFPESLDLPLIANAVDLVYMRCRRQQ